MSIVLARRLRGFHALLEMALRDERTRPQPDEMALRDERTRPQPDDRAVASIKKKKLAIRDRLVAFNDRQGRSTSR